MVKYMIYGFDSVRNRSFKKYNSDFMDALSFGPSLNISGYNISGSSINAVRPKLSFATNAKLLHVTFSITANGEPVLGCGIIGTTEGTWCIPTYRASSTGLQPAIEYLTIAGNTLQLESAFNATLSVLSLS